MRALVTHGHFRSRDKDDGHTIRSAVAENSIHAPTARLCVLQKRSYCRSKFYIAGIGIFALFALWPWPWPDDLHTQTWPVSPRDMMRVTERDTLKKLSKRRNSFDVRKYVFLNMIHVVDKRNSLSECCSCITCVTLNSLNFKVTYSRWTETGNRVKVVI